MRPTDEPGPGVQATQAGPARPEGVSDTISRRRLLELGGMGAAALVAAGCMRPGGPPTTTTTTPGGAACRLTPEQTEGPYYLDNDLVRSNIIDGHPGTPLRLELLVENAACAALAGAAVDIWHCDAAGAYSGFGAGASSRTFLRGTQIADAAGKVVFETIYPGWYVGRATHIHVKVHTGGREIHTGQLYFDEALNDAVYRQAPYSSKTGNRVRNTGDGIYRNGGAESLVAVAPSIPGYVGRKTLVVS
jgi:protocatechuate 3,4-dioxygenase beta subunit